MIEAYSFDVIVVGGGLAGLTSALHLSKKGASVLLVEKNKYPRHKVCGEYISNEVLPYLKALDFDPFDFGAIDIVDFKLSTVGSRSINSKLPEGGFSISRYRMDSELAKKAIENGVQILHSTVTNIEFKNDQFDVYTNQNGHFSSEFIIGSFGKRSNLDVKMKRGFINESSPFLAVKAHYKGNFPANTVELHNFKGGYCGVSKVENDSINVCYLTDYQSFKKFKSIESFQNKVLSENRFLKQMFDSFELIFEKPLAISQVSFSSKSPVENHILMCGDSAGMIHPLAGNGMSMAIKAAQMVSNLILNFKAGKINSRSELESQYIQTWNKEFALRLTSGKVISRLFRLGYLSSNNHQFET